MLKSDSRHRCPLLAFIRKSFPSYEPENVAIGFVGLFFIISGEVWSKRERAWLIVEKFRHFHPCNYKRIRDESFEVCASLRKMGSIPDRAQGLLKVGMCLIKIVMDCSFFESVIYLLLRAIRPGVGAIYHEKCGLDFEYTYAINIISYVAWVIKRRLKFMGL